MATPGYGTRLLQQWEMSPASRNATVAEHQQMKQEAATIDHREEARSIAHAQKIEADATTFTTASIEKADAAIEQFLDLSSAVEMDTISAAEAVEKLGDLDRELEQLRRRREEVLGHEQRARAIREDPHAFQDLHHAKYPLLQDTRFSRGLNGD